MLLIFSHVKLYYDLFIGFEILPRKRLIAAIIGRFPLDICVFC